MTSTETTIIIAKIHTITTHVDERFDAAAAAIKRNTDELQQVTDVLRRYAENK